MTLSDRLRPWHRRNAFVLLVFLTAHILTHLTAVLGPESQAVVMKTFRLVYRTPFIEYAIIALFVSQVLMGIVLVTQRLRQAQKTAWSWIQIASGLYLMVFILNHIFLGVLRGRTYESVDTGFYFVAATLITAPVRYGFIPYYFLAVLALFSHIAAALHWAGKPDLMTRGLIIGGTLIAAIIVGSYGGVFYDIALPEPYRAYMDNAF